MISASLLALSALSLSWAAVGGLERRLVARGVLDRPNARSSHSVPTPRGGGAGLLAAAFFSLLVIDGRRWTDVPALIALLGVVPTAAVGWIDDRRSLGVGVRLAAHVVTAVSFLPLALAGRALDSPLVTIAFAAWWTFVAVSAINVVNFMDGIDGLIGLQSAIFGAHLALLAGTDTLGGRFGVVLAAASVGFLGWNWAPARIFLGDVGSGALGALGVLGGLLTLQAQRLSLWPVFLPMSPIVLDAATTIVRRWLRGEDLTQAHRSHLYQHLALRWGHAWVCALYGAVAAAGSALVLASRGAPSAALMVAYLTVQIVIGATLHAYVTRPEPT